MLSCSPMQASVTSDKGMTEPVLSVVIPAKNEEDRLDQTVGTLIAECKRLEVEFEIIVVDDGSTDNTVSKAMSLGCHVISNERNYGIAYSFRAGAAHAQGRHVMFCPADITNFDFFEKAIAILDKYDVVSISKYHPDSVIIGYNAYRRILSKGYNFVINILYGGVMTSDTHYIKFYRKDKLCTILSECKINGAVGETEILVKMKKLHPSYIDLPAKVVHKQEQSKTSRTIILRTFFDLLKLRFQ